MTDEERYDSRVRTVLEHGLARSLVIQRLATHRQPEWYRSLIERYGPQVLSVPAGVWTIGEVIQALHGFRPPSWYGRDEFWPCVSDDCYREDDGGDVSCTRQCKAYEGDRG